ncbi:MAG: type I-D CRISPR-associated helicase Cas3' [Candidatus Bathyarchaeia archaeon]
MLKPVEIQVNPLYIPFAQKDWGIETKIRPYDFQEKVHSLYDFHSSFMLTAGTGAGKTAAIVLPTIWRALKRQGPEGLLAIYPTNELVLDQARSICKLLTKELGKAVSIWPPAIFNRVIRGMPDDVKSRVKADGVGDLSVVVLSAPILVEHRVSENLLDWSNAKALLYTIFGKASLPLIILSNPDIIYLITEKVYGLYDLSTAERNRLMGNLSKLTLMFDEFHFWSGQEFAHALMFLSFLKNICPKIFLSSATPLGKENLIKYALGDIKKIGSETTANMGRIILHPAFIKFYPQGDSLAEAQENVVQTALEIAEDRIKDLERPKLPILIIVDRLIDQICIANELTKKGYHVGEYTGWYKSKEKMDEFDFIVGTSAIEVGIDFKVYEGIFFSSMAPALIQRIGRVGRTSTEERPSLESSFVHIITSNGIASLVKSKSEKRSGVLTREEFNRLINDIYPAQDLHAWYVDTVECKAQHLRFLKTFKPPYNGPLNTLYKNLEMSYTSIHGAIFKAAEELYEQLIEKELHGVWRANAFTFRRSGLDVFIQDLCGKRARFVQYDLNFALKNMNLNDVKSFKNVEEMAEYIREQGDAPLAELVKEAIGAYVPKIILIVNSSEGLQRNLGICFMLKSEIHVNKLVSLRNSLTPIPSQGGRKVRDALNELNPMCFITKISKRERENLWNAIRLYPVYYSTLQREPDYHVAFYSDALMLQAFKNTKTFT